MANGKSDSEIKVWYNYHIDAYKMMEENALSQMETKAATAIKDLLALTSEDSQNKELEESIARLESVIDYETVINSGATAAQIQSQVAAEILALDAELQILGKNTSGLQALAEGDTSKILSKTSGGETLVSNTELNSWIIKIMTRISDIKEKDKEKSFTGYLSNLKGAYLEAAVMKILYANLPIGVEAEGTFDGDSIDIINSGNIRAGKRQIAEDILILFGDKSKRTLQEVINNPNNKTKSGRIRIDIPTYSTIQEQSVGISVKAGNSPIKFYEGNLNKFFTDDDSDLRAYHNNVLARVNTSMSDNEKGRSVNRYLVAMHLDEAIGTQNLFLSTRNNLLSSMSQKLAELRDNRQLYMTAYKVSKGSITGRVIE